VYIRLILSLKEVESVATQSKPAKVFPTIEGNEVIFYVKTSSSVTAGLSPIHFVPEYSVPESISLDAVATTH